MNREELANLLRRARGRLTPEAVGLGKGERRRVPGLRREEVAALAGVSVDYVVRLEQGRGPKPSASVLRGLARALQLGDDEHRELFELAGIAPPRAGEVPMRVRPSVLRLVDRLSDHPVMVLSAKGDVLAWNALAAALLGDWSAVPVRERNIAWQRFTGGGQRSGNVVHVREDEERTAAQVVTTLRTAMVKYPNDTDLKRLVAELRRRSERFGRLWNAAPTDPWHGHTKTVQHPAVGQLTLDLDVMLLPDTDQSVIVYSAEPGSEAAERLDLVRVLGLQHLSDAPTSVTAT